MGAKKNEMGHLVKIFSGCIEQHENFELLYSKKLAVVPGNAFGSSGEGFIRCSYAYSIDNINEALNRMDMFLKEIK